MKILKSETEFKTMFEWLQSGSSKDIYQKKSNIDQFYFSFSDRYSIFDWGEMPDKIPYKGKSQADFTYSLYLFLENPKNWQTNELLECYPSLKEKDHRTLEKLQSSGLKHHIEDIIYTPNQTLLAVKKFNTIMPPFKNGIYNYQAYQNKPENTVIPLEVIFRFGLTESSSLLKRLDDPAYCEAIQIDPNQYEIGKLFETPIIEYSTKFESHDRYLLPNEAQIMAGLTESEFSNLEKTTRLIALQLKFIFSKIDVKLWDGKFEFALGKSDNGFRSLILIDSIGLDELRLTKNESILSKEKLREYYRDTTWKVAVDKSKKLAASRKTFDWKSICMHELKEIPAPLTPDKIKVVSEMYQTVEVVLS